jgi:hypothetical protein
MGDKQQQPESAGRLVVVLESNDQIQLAMAKGLLEHAGIPLFIQGQLATLYRAWTDFSISGSVSKYRRIGPLRRENFWNQS